MTRRRSNDDRPSQAGEPSLAGTRAKTRTARAFTLLEVILSLAILAGSLAALGEVMRLADESAGRTRDETQAHIIASSIIDEITSGARAFGDVNQAVYDPTMDPPWLYSITIEPTGYDALLAARITLEQQIDARLQPTRYQLVRWLPNPDYMANAASAAAAAAESGSTSGSGTSSGTGSSTGGAP